jgi:DNA-binding transcriptional ArsR family regulator
MSTRSNTARRDDGLDAVFHALADPTRRRIVARLALGDQSVSALAAPFEMTLPGVSKHLRVLERAGIVAIARRGGARRCELRPRALERASAFLDRYRAFWTGNLDQLARWAERHHKKSRR